MKKSFYFIFKYISKKLTLINNKFHNIAYNIKNSSKYKTRFTVFDNSIIKIHS